MICPTCHGTGYAREGLPDPCIECQGSGLTHCCEGHQATALDWLEQIDEPGPVAEPAKLRRDSPER